MDNKDLQKFLRESSETPRPIPSGEMDWEGLSAQLDSIDQTKSYSLGRVASWIPWLLVTGLVFSNLFFMYQSNETQQRITTLEQQQSEQSSEQQLVDVQLYHDTVVYTKTIFIHDTIYLTNNNIGTISYLSNHSNSTILSNTTFLNKPLKTTSKQNTILQNATTQTNPNQPNFNNNTLITNGNHLSNDAKTTFQNNNTLNQVEGENSTNFTTLGEHTKTDNVSAIPAVSNNLNHQREILSESKQKVTTLDPLLISAIYQEDTSVNQKLPVYNFDNTKRQKKQPFKYLIPKTIDALTPTGYALGINGGGHMPLLKGIDLEDQYLGWSSGISGSLDFSKQVSLWTDISYTKVFVTTHRMDTTLGIPVINPPTEDHVLKKVHLNNNYLNWVIGLKYQPFISNKWSSYLTIGYGGQLLMPYKIEYDFEDSINDDEETIKRTVNDYRSINHLLQSGVGVTYHLNKRLDFSLEANYKTVLFKSGLTSPNLIGINSRILYHF